MKLAIALPILASLLLFSSPQAGVSLPLEEYWQRVQATRDLVASLGGVTPDAAHQQLEAEAGRWEEVSAVLLPDGRQIPVDPTHLVSLLRADPPDLERLEQALAALLAARDSWPAQRYTSLDNSTLERVLSRPEFQWRKPRPSPLAEWWNRLMERLAELLGRSGQEAAGLWNLFAVLAGLVLAAVVAYILSRLRGGLAVEAEADRQKEAEEDLTASSALKQARLLAEARDYRTAVRYLYLSSLLILEERGLLRYDRSRTNREYLSSVAGSPQLAAALRPVIDVFERVWYGLQPLDRDSYSRYEEWVDDLQRQR